MENRKSQWGFTLMEMLIVIALVAIFTVVAVPSYRALTADNQITGALNDFANTLGEARSAAVARGQTVIICPSSNAMSTTPTCNSPTANPQQWNAGWISFVDENGNGTYDSGPDTILRVHGPLPSDVTLTSTSGGGTLQGYIGFNRMGFASPTFGSVSQLLVKACPVGNSRAKGASLKLVRAGSLSTLSGGC